MNVDINFFESTLNKLQAMNLTGLVAESAKKKISLFPENKNQIKNRKKELAEKTKILRTNFSSAIPKQEVLDLIQMYSQNVEIIKSLNSEIDSSIASIFKIIASTLNPADLVSSLIKTLSLVPDYSDEILKLRKEIKSKKEKTITLSQLQDKMAQLKLECDEQVRLQLTTKQK